MNSLKKDVCLFITGTTFKSIFHKDIKDGIILLYQ